MSDACQAQHQGFRRHQRAGRVRPRQLRERRFAPKDTIFTPGDPEDQLYFLLSERLRQSDEVIGSPLHREVSTRLTTLLVNLSERFGEGVLIDVRLTHQDLANMIASTREAVSKVMSEFQRDGVIETRNRRIAILDRGALSKQASVDGQLPI